MAYLELRDVDYMLHSKKEPPRALFTGLSFACDQKDFISLSGDNGIGKTTLSQLLMGIIKPDTGSVLLEGMPIDKMALHEVGLKVGYLFQNPSLQLFNRNIGEELHFAHTYGVITKGEVDKRYKEVIDLLGLNHALETPLVQLSQGEKQRVALGTILMNDPEFIILDEPTVGLDPDRKTILRDLLIRLNQQGIGLLVISHDQDFIQSLPAMHLRLEQGGLIHDHLV